ncbi:MAG TPA: LPXTG cell wall anchor domain-containing protein [Ktedonobacteraceae bacterium]|nr:LPXTG cell wall anchor domain-containing protein [Ktedonobacteraceae bacterium]
MQNQVNRLQWAVILVALRVVGVVAVCVATLSFSAFHATPHAYAADASLRFVSGSISSFPAVGPAGTVITVAGSGWGDPDGTAVTFGYVAVANSSTCTIVTNAQNGSLGSGSFTGSFPWPTGTALSTYPVCAMIGTTMAVAGNFSVISSTPPPTAVSISPSILSPNIQATITASNYYPAGMQVNFSWMSGNTVIDNLNSATSDANGMAVLNFTVPSLSIASGSYTINASVGSGQTAMLPGSTSFTYNAPVLPPSPTPRPSPSPTPKPTPAPTQTTTPGITPTTKATAGVTATTTTTATTGTTPTVSASPTVASSQVAATNGTTPGSSNGSNTDTPATGSSDKTILIVAGLVVLLGLLAGVVGIWLVIRNRKAASALATLSPAVSNNPWQASWSNARSGFMNEGAMPPVLYNNPAANANANTTMFQPQANNMPATTNMPAPMPVPAGAGTSTGYGNWHPPITVPADPALDAMQRRAQEGLFAAPRPFQDERSR